MRHPIKAICAAAAVGLGPVPVSSQSTQTDNAMELSFASAPSLSARSSGRSDIPGSFAVAAPEVVKLGWGWSEQRGEAIPTECILFSEGSGGAQTSNITIREVSDSYTLAKAMDVSASTTVRAFGAKVDGKASISKNSKITSMSVTYVVRAEVLNDSVYVAPPLRGDTGGPVPKAETVAVTTGAPAPIGPSVRLTDEAAALAQSNPTAFRRICGDGYVSAAVSGARAYLVSVVKTQSKEERETMRASVTGEGWGQKASVAAGSDKTATSSSYERDLTFFQEGGSATQTNPAPVTADTGDADPDAPAPNPLADSDLPADADQAIARIRKLATAARDAGKLFEISISPYEALANYPEADARLSDLDEHEDLAALMGAYETLYDDLTEALADREGYAAPVRSCGDTCSTTLVSLKEPDAFRQVEDAQDIALLALDQLEQMAQACFAAGDDCTIDLSAVRSPYAAYVNAPIPVASGEAVPELDDHVSIFLRDTSAGRCRLGARTPGCITNAMIRAWQDRQGMKSVPVDNVAEVVGTIAECETIADNRAYRGDANDPDASIVWTNPAVTFDRFGNLVCPPA
ncbi:hypothetical protein [uncultured Tateyamaria sp.]|uniref:hypothetical protein n=1 Tax=uncultured Tateyamaria sp. TaxID=455651 RepID=UPI00260F92C5|nr:hypothetical protein [uncultured Tateyamaria sp.]